MGNVSQAELSKVFGRSQHWVSVQQRRHEDPMPKDLEGAVDWGRKHGRLAGDPDLAEPVQAGLSLGRVAEADVKLKTARTEKLQAELGRELGHLLHRTEVEEREIRIASQFRRVAVEYPGKARAVLERHITDGVLIARIVEDLQPIAAELLNAADPVHALRGRSREEIRAVLLGEVERILEAC